MDGDQEKDNVEEPGIDITDLFSWIFEYLMLILEF